MHILDLGKVNQYLTLLVEHGDLVASVVSHLHLYCDPLLVWQEKGTRLRFIVVLLGIEMEACETSGREEKHEHILQVSNVAAVLSLLQVARSARFRLDVDLHRHGVSVLVLFQAVDDAILLHHLTLVNGYHALSVKREWADIISNQGSAETLSWLNHR